MSNLQVPQIKSQLATPESTNSLACLYLEYSDPCTIQFHSGLLYRTNSAEKFELLHLAWHNRLRKTNDLVTKRFLFTQINIHLALQQYLASYLQLIWDSNRIDQIPYGLSVPSGIFEKETGKSLIPREMGGLTCSSFILAVFDGASLPYLDLESFRHRKEDEQWGSRIIGQLKTTTNISSTQINEMAKVVGKVCRYRPSEVVAASLLRPKDAKFDLLIELGEQLEQITISHHNGSSVEKSILAHLS